MPLTDNTCKAAACPADKKRARFTDSGGLYLEVAPNGSKRWFWKYILSGKEKRLALASCPATSLKSARGGRDKARLIQLGGNDPAQAKRVTKLQNQHRPDETFEAVAREFFAVKASGLSKQYGARWIERMDKDAFPPGRWGGTFEPVLAGQGGLTSPRPHRSRIDCGTASAPAQTMAFCLSRAPSLLAAFSLRPRIR